MALKEEYIIYCEDRMFGLDGQHIKTYIQWLIYQRMINSTLGPRSAIMKKLNQEIHKVLDAQK